MTKYYKLSESMANSTAARRGKKTKVIIWDTSRNKRKVTPLLGEMTELKDLSSKPAFKRKRPDTCKNIRQELTMAAREGNVNMIKNYKGLDTIVKSQDSTGFTMLHHMARINKGDLVELMLDNGADINAKGAEGYTPLHLTTRYNCVEAAKVLLRRNADSTIPADDGSVPLHAAARQGLLEIAKLLVEKSPECANCPMIGNQTPFALACMNGHYEMASLLIGYGADISYVNVEKKTPLHLATVKGDSKVIHLLIETAKKQQLKLPEFVDAVDYEFNTPLHIACVSGWEKALQELLANGADVNSQRLTNKETPLHFAARGGHVKIMEELLKHGADIHLCCSMHWTPLHRAAVSNQIEAITFLVSKGANIESFDFENYTPFLLAVKFNRTKAVAKLLELGADLEAKNSMFMTCLHLAAGKNKCTDTLEMLLDKDDGTLLCEKEIDLQTPLHYAAAKGNVKGIELLVNKGSLVTARDVNEQCPLHIAAGKGEVDATQLLTSLADQRDVSRDVYGQTPLHRAAAKGYRKTCEALLNQMASTTVRDLNHRTPLHAAVTSGSVHTVHSLLTGYMGSRQELLEMTDTNGNTALHLASVNDEVKILQVLLDEGANVTARNDESKTCLDVAIDWERTEAALTLVQHERWWEVLCTKSSDGEWPMVRLIQTLPIVAKAALDQCVECCPLPTTDSEFYVNFNLELLDPGPEKQEDCSLEAAEKMVEHDCEELLNHPVTQALLRHKWFAFGKIPFYLNFFVFLVFVSLVSYFVVSEREKITIYYPTHINASKEEEKLLNEKQTSSTTAIAIVITLFATVEFLKEIYQVFMVRQEYFKSLSNYVEIVLYVNALIFVVPYHMHAPAYPDVYGQWNAGAITLFLSFVNILLYIKRVGTSGIYVSMYFEVWYTFLKVILVFLVIIVGSSLVFFVLLKEEDNFSQVGFSFVKTFVMMVGELDYTDMLSSNAINKNISPKTNAPYVPLPEITYCFFFFFLVMVPILLMNLLVGLAVGDIDSIQKTASMTRLKDQVTYVVDIQKRYPLKMVQYLYTKELKVFPNKNRLLRSLQFSGASFIDREYLNEILEIGEDDKKKVEKQDDNEYLQKQDRRIKELEEKVDEQTRLLHAIAEKFEINV